MAKKHRKKPARRSRARGLGRIEEAATRSGRRTVCRIAGGETVPMADVKQCAKACGSKWFDPGSMRFFETRLPAVAYPDNSGGAYFVTSERGPDRRRRYSVRRYEARVSGHQVCNVDTVGEFQAYETGDAAHRVARRKARGK